MKTINEKIDFVVTWVDGSDIDWQNEKKKYMLTADVDASMYRYRDYGFLKYWFRGIEKYAPWVNKIYFVTCGHLPSWLDTTNPKLVIIKHEDYIPKEYLPTFNSNVIEIFMNRIKGLSNNFVVFNDDFYIINKTKETDFFKNNVPVDMAALNVHSPKRGLISQNICLNNIEVLNCHFDFKKSINHNLFKWLNLKNGRHLLRTIPLLKCPRFPGIYQHHLAIPYNKSTFDEVWRLEKAALLETANNKFRNKNDLSHWLFREWQLASGNFYNRSNRIGKAFYIDRDGFKTVNDIVRYISNQKGKIIAINDGEMSEKEYDIFITQTKAAFDKILPEKSKFEK